MNTSPTKSGKSSQLCSNGSVSSTTSVPTPNLDGLSEEEMRIISDVIRKQIEFEEQEKSMTKKLENDLLNYEREVRRESLVNKSRIQSLDLHLCKLCFKNKLTDGIGRVCFNCNKRVCNNCGCFSPSKYLDKKNKGFRGKWICRLCFLRRDILCKSGNWFYHDDSGIKSDLSDEFSHYSTHNEDLPVDESMSHDKPIQSIDKSHVDIGQFQNSSVLSESNVGRIHRRRLVKHQSGSGIIENSSSRYKSHNNNNDSDRKQRYRHRRRTVSRIYPLSHDNSLIGKRPDHSLNQKQYNFDSDATDRTDNSEVNDRELGDYSISKSNDRRSYYKSGQNCSESCNKCYSSSTKMNSLTFDEGSTVEEGGIEDLTSECEINPIKDRNCGEVGNVSRIKRQDAVSCSSSSTSIASTKVKDVYYRSLSVSVANDTAHSEATVKSKPRLPLHLESTRNSKIFLSLPDHDNVQPCATTNYSEKLLSPLTPTYRRISLSQCENLNIRAQQDNDEGRFLPSNPHQVIIHKDRNDKSYSTGGLGMRIVGGKVMDDGTTGVKVTHVIPGGPADIQGNITIGDYILEWNGRSLMGVTFEETRQIIDASGDIVQLVILYSSTDDRERSKSRTPEPEPSATIPRSGSVDANILVQVDEPDDLSTDPNFIPHKPKRRMLPKTPIEIKRETRIISGRLLVQLEYAHSCDHLKIGLIRAEGLKPRSGAHKKLPRPSVMIHLLPNRSDARLHETQLSFDTTNPEWNSTFVFQNITRNHIQEAALEITVWDNNASEVENEFLGEVLLDLKDAKLNNEAIWYDLEDHDENSSPLPNKKSSGDIFHSSPGSSVDTTSQRQTSLSSQAASPDSTPPLPISHDTSHDTHPLHLTPSREKRRLYIKGKSISNKELKPRVEGREAYNLSDNDLQSAISRRSDGTRDSFTKKMKRKMSSVIKVSSGILPAVPSSVDDELDQQFTRSLSVTDLVPSREQSHSPVTNRRLTMPMELLSPPRTFSQLSESSSYYDDVSEDDRLLSELSLPSPSRPAPEGNENAFFIGPGQLAPKPSTEKMTRGSIKMSFMVSKGQLEVDIICVKGLPSSPNNTPLDTYVKTYLIDGAKTIQKKKTKVVKASCNPVFRQKLKYSACNVYGRSMRVRVWEKQRAFDKKDCLGEVVVKLDNINLTDHTTGWYSMFDLSTADMGSCESLQW